MKIENRKQPNAPLAFELSLELNVMIASFFFFPHFNWIPNSLLLGLELYRDGHCSSINEYKCIV